MNRRDSFTLKFEDLQIGNVFRATRLFWAYTKKYERRAGGPPLSSAEDLEFAIDADSMIMLIGIDESFSTRNKYIEYKILVNERVGLLYFSVLENSWDTDSYIIEFLSDYMVPEIIS